MTQTQELTSLSIFPSRHSKTRLLCSIYVGPIKHLNEHRQYINTQFTVSILLFWCSAHVKGTTIGRFWQNWTNWCNKI